MCSLNQDFKKVLSESGLKMRFVSEQTGIEYQRLNRILNQGATMGASEFIVLCKFFGVNPEKYLEEVRFDKNSQKAS